MDTHFSVGIIKMVHSKVLTTYARNQVSGTKEQHHQSPPSSILENKNPFECYTKSESRRRRLSIFGFETLEVGNARRVLLYIYFQSSNNIWSKKQYLKHAKQKQELFLKEQVFFDGFFLLARRRMRCLHISKEEMLSDV